ncbi:Hybrid signal transduction histidine kinase J [Sesbania bispinosa]|nr:Hybrid signal transduction histidine kinase J [Sesbania bispinosa]
MVASNSNEISSLSTHQVWDDKAIHGKFSAIWYREPLDPVSGEKIGKAMQIAPEDLINIVGLSQVPDVIRLGAEWLQRNYGSNFPSSHEIHVKNAKLGHQQYYIDSFFLN